MKGLLRLMIIQPLRIYLMSFRFFYTVSIALLFCCVNLTPSEISFRGSLALAEVVTPEARVTEANRFISQGFQKLYEGDSLAAIQAWQQAIGILRESNVRSAFPQETRGAEVIVLSFLGHVYQSQNQYQQAAEAYEQALLLVRESNVPYIEAGILNGLGNAYRSLGQYQQSLGVIMQALELARQLDHRLEEAIALTNLSTTYLALQDYQQALDAANQARSIAYEGGDRDNEGNALISLAQVHFAMGNFEQVITSLEQAIILFQETKNEWGEALARRTLEAVRSSIEARQ